MEGTNHRRPAGTPRPLRAAAIGAAAVAAVVPVGTLVTLSAGPMLVAVAALLALASGAILLLPLLDSIGTHDAAPRASVVPLQRQPERRLVAHR